MRAFSIQVQWSDAQRDWAHRAQSSECSWRCRLSQLPEASQLYAQIAIRGLPCEGCHLPPFPKYQQIARFVWSRLKVGVPLWQATSDVDNDELDCTLKGEGGVPFEQRAKCTVGQMAQNLLCFSHLFSSDLGQAMIHLELGMELTKFATGNADALTTCGNWGFALADVAWNYELHLLSGWHIHNQKVPRQLNWWHVAPMALTCPRHRPMEEQEFLAIDGEAVRAQGTPELPTRCVVGACKRGEYLATVTGSTLALCQATCSLRKDCHWFAFCPAGPQCTGENANACVLHKSCQEWKTSSKVPGGFRFCSKSPDTFVKEDERKARVLIQCLVLTVLAWDAERMAAIAETYARDCDALYFVTASDGPPAMHGYSVIDIREHFPNVPTDPPDSTVDAANTIMKTHHTMLLAHLLGQNTTRMDLSCRLDADTFFVPNNLRRIHACRGFDSEYPWAIGHVSYAHKHQAPGVAYPFGGSGICLSSGAVRSYYEFHAAGGVKYSSKPGAWASGDCVLGPGHWDDVTLGVCLQLARVRLSRWSSDCRGRELFWPLEFEEALHTQPPGGPTALIAAWGEGLDIFNYWRFRTLQHFACENARWLGDFPVSYHGIGRGCGNRSTAMALYAALHAGKQVRGGGTLRVWNGVVTPEACADLVC